MPEEPATNKLSIYLLKKGVSPGDGAVIDGLEGREVDSVGSLFLIPSARKTPGWVRKFFAGTLNVDNLPIYSASAKAVLLVSDIGAEKRSFAVCFGYGKHLLEDGAIEERFGLVTALNIVDPDVIRSLDKTSLESVPKHSHEQISQDGSKEVFGIDVEQDLIRGMAGKPKTGFEGFGSVIAGKDALYVSVKIDASNLKGFLAKCYERYKSDDYKKNDFDWIDQIAEVRDRKLIDDLDEKLVEKINSENFEKLWMAAPEEINWADVKGFRFKKNQEEELDDIRFISYLEDKEASEVSLAQLKRDHVYAISASTEDELHHWTVYKCLYCELDHNGHVFLCTGGKWYQVDRDFLSSVNRSFGGITHSSIELPDYTDEDDNEGKYNERAATELSGACLDGQNIPYGGGYSKVEFCDVMLASGEVIHVKRYSGSSVLSHLFSQGVVSGEVYLSDSEFRKEVNKRLPAPLRLKNPEKQYQPDGRKIVYAIISASDKELDLPFFSKVSLRNAVSRLQGFGYAVELRKVLNTSTE